MELMYSSTRNDKVKLTASQAILKGLADDGGLFVPERIPTLDVPMDTLADMSYQETAYEVMSRFFTDFTEDSLKEFILQIPQLQIKEIWTTGDVREGRGDERWLNILICKGKIS